MRNMIKSFSKFNILGLMMIASLGVSCSKSNTQTLPPAAQANILTIGGGAVSIKAQDLPILLKSQEILDDSDQPVKDGTLFIVTGSNSIPVSLDGITFSNSIKVASQNAIISFSARPSTQVGTYTVKVIQNQKQSKNATGTFYVDVTPAAADDLGLVVTNRVETIPPPTIRYSVLADGVTQGQVIVGPIIDKYGNQLKTGYVRILTDKGSVVSANPATISDGYAFFSFLPTTQESSVNVKAQAVDEAAAVIIKEQIGTIYQVKPHLQFSSDEDIGNFLLGQSASINATLTNVGSTVANNVVFSTILPFSLPSIATQCPTTLNVGDSCSFTIQANSAVRSNIVGAVVAQSDNVTIPEAKATLGLTARAIDPAHLSVTSSLLNFNSVCAKTVDQEVDVQNMGELDATNFSIVDTFPMSQDNEAACNAFGSASLCSTNSLCRWKSTNVCTSKAFDIIVAAKDSVISGPVANCGTTIPAGGIKCKLIVRFYPMSLYSNYQTSFRVQADGVSPVPVNLNASSGIGDPAIQIPITFNKTEIGLSHTDLAGVTLGPVTDQCGDKLNNLDSYSASVTAGSLSSSTGVFANGGATFNWNGSDSITDMGTQTLTVTAGTITNSATIPFTGVKISLASNPINIAEVNADTPASKTWIIQNNGNKQTSISNISFSNLKNVSVTSSDISGCAVLPANGTCTVSVLFQPIITSDPSSVQFSGQLSVLSPGRGQNSDSIQFLGFGSRTINIGNNDSQFYYLGQAPAGVGVTKVITVKNNSASTLSALNFSITGPTQNWTYSPLTCGVSLSPGQTCTFQMQYSSSDTTAGNKQTVLNISSGVRYTNLTFSLDLIGDVNNINPTIPMTATLSAIPADGTSKTSVTAGVVKDLLNNQLSPGTPVYFSTSKGSILETQPIYLGSDGKATVTVQSSNNQVGNSSVRADVKNPQGQIVSSGFYTVKYTGVYLTFDSAINPIDFGKVPLGEFKDIHVTLKNTGTANAPNLNISTSNPIFTIADLGTCSIGSLNVGQSCDLVVRYNSSSLASSSGVTGVLTASTSEPTGQNTTSINLHAVSLLPATLAASIKTLAIPLQVNSIYATQVTLTNIGADTLRNFTLISNTPNNILLTSYDACNNLVGGASCQFTLTFNSAGINGLFSSIITAAGDNTSVQINFIADTMHLAFINPNFSADVFTCQPIQVQTQDSNSNAMISQNNLTLTIASNKLGSFYGNQSCSGTSLAKVTISQGGTTSPQLYFQPKVAGKHLLTVNTGTISGVQENLANLVISPGKIVNASPRQPISFTAIGAQGDVHCSFVLNSSGSTDPIPAFGKSCNYVAGNLGSVVDRIILSDSDNPPNTAALQISVGPSVSISPTTQIVNSGDQIQFTASNGSGVGYVFSSTPNQPNKKIGSSIYGNIYTAGQNVTGTDNLVETVTVTDSYGATASALVEVKKSIFTQQQVLSAPTTGSKTIAMWGNFMLVGDPSAQNADGVQGAGAVHIYQKNTAVANQTTWTLLSTMYSPFPIANGSFGQSIAMWNNQIVIGAPKEAGTNDAAESGVIYYLTMDTNGVPSTMTRLFSSYKKQLKPKEHFGELVGITQQFLVGYNSNRAIATIYDYTNFVQTGSTCNIQGFSLCPDQELQPNGDTATSLAIFNNDDYGGAFLAIGSANDGLGAPQLAGSGAVRVYKRQANIGTPGGDWITNSNQTFLPEATTNLSAGAHLGASVAMYGPYLIVGAPGYNNGKGRVLIFRRDPNVGDNLWSVEDVIKPEDYNSNINPGANFGQTLAYFGNYIMVGAQGETNYPGLVKSGSAFIFQRFLSDNNRWEFLGELKSTDYAANNNLGSSMALFTNDFAIASFNNNTGLIYTFNGGKFINKWPFGFHGIFSSTTDYQQQSKMKDWASLVIPAQIKYSIAPRADGSVSYIGVAGDTVINGKLAANGSTFNSNISGQLPDDSGFLLGPQETYSIIQSAGGPGANGEYGSGQAVVSASCGAAYYPNFGSPAGAGGMLQTNGNGGNGGQSGNSALDIGSFLSNYCGGSDHGGCFSGGGIGCSSGNSISSPNVAGGTGGLSGTHGQYLSLKLNGNMSGTGFIDVSGQNGINGQDGAGANTASTSCAHGGSDDGDAEAWNSSFCGSSDWTGTSYISMYTNSGRGGGGGGGAGGTAGFFELFTPDGRTTSPFNIFLGGGNEGTFGRGGSTSAGNGYKGIFGCYSINNNLLCGDIVLKDSSDINFVAGKNYKLIPDGDALKIIDVTDGNALVENNVGYYIDNGFNINQTCIWKFSSVTIPAGVTLTIDPACKWTQILVQNKLVLNGTILANNITDSNSANYNTQEMFFNGEFTTNVYQSSIFQPNGGSGGPSYDDTNAGSFCYGCGGPAPTPSYSYLHYEGSQGAGNGGGGSGAYVAYYGSPSVGERNGTAGQSGDAALSSRSLCNQRRSSIGAAGVNGNACVSISGIGDKYPGGGGFRGSHGQNIFIKSPTGIIGNGTINVQGTNGGPGGNSYSYTGGVSCSTRCEQNEDCLYVCKQAKASATAQSLTVVGAGGGGAGGSGGTIVVKSPSNPANINFLYGKGLGGAGGVSNVTFSGQQYDTNGYGYSYGTPPVQTTNSYQDINTAGNPGANGSNGVYNFIQTTNLK
jgi:hypothetical protein